MNGKNGWIAIVGTALAGLAGFAVQEDNNDLCIEALKLQAQGQARAELALAKEMAEHHGPD